MSLNYEVKTVRVNGGETDYIVFGTGRENMVIIPGVSMKSVIISAPAVAASYSRFSADYTVYLFDRKKNIQKGYSVADMAYDTAEAMKILGIENACIFGTSQGGMIAQYIAADYPELVKKLFLGSTLVYQNDISKSTFSCWLELLRKGNIADLNRKMFKDIYSSEYHEKYADAFRLLENQGTPDEVRRLEILMEACIGFDGIDKIHKIKCPVMAVGSEKDAVVSGEGTLQIAKLLNCGYYLYDGYGHAVYDEAADYKERIENFFKS